MNTPTLNLQARKVLVGALILACGVATLAASLVARISHAEPNLEKNRLNVRFGILSAAFRTAPESKNLCVGPIQNGESPAPMGHATTAEQRKEGANAPSYSAPDGSVRKASSLIARLEAMETPE